MSTEKQVKKVSALRNGTVIDHISAKNLFNVISILGLDKIETQITFGTNLESTKLGKKAIIKISEVFFKDEDVNKIALFSPHAKLNKIEDFKVVEKRDIQVPDTIRGIVKCVNPKCITNNENVKTKFTVVDKDNVSLKCHYCEKHTNQEDLQFNL